MCDPIIGAGILASGAGAIFNAKQQSKFQQAQFDAEQARQATQRAAREAERVRQAGIDEKSFDQVRQALTDVAPVDRADMTTAEATAPDNAIVNAGDRYQPLPRSQDAAGSVMGDAGKLRDEASRVKQRIAAMAMLTAQGVDQSDAARRIGALGQKTADLRSKGRRSSSVADFEAAIPAAQVTPSNSLFGDLLMAGGQLASGYGGQSLGTSGASPASALLPRNLFKNLAGG